MVHCISLGAGVQSSTMALMAKHGLIKPMPDFAIFADTKSEPKSVYDWLDYLETELPFPVKRLTKGNLGDYATTVRKSKNGNYWTGGQPPVFAIGDSGKPSPMMRQCTQEFKINVIVSHLRKYKPTVQWIGISFDEAHRMKPSRESFIENRWPLIELLMKREDCLNWMEKNNYRRPPRSACVFCPYQSDREWLRLKTEEPEDFNKAVMFEINMNVAKNKIGFSGDIRLHRSMKWIDEVEFDKHKNQIDMFGNECEGMCGV